jgi:phosphodiesterase/alkaline phosphatase D-like protein
VPRALGLPTAATLARDVAFTQGVASGEPTPGGITLWTRLEGLEGPRHPAERRERDRPGRRADQEVAPADASPQAATAETIQVEEGPRTPSGPAYSA